MYYDEAQKAWVVDLVELDNNQQQNEKAEVLVNGNQGDDAQKYV